MLDPIIKATRKIRAKISKEIRRNPAKYYEERERQFRAIESEMALTGITMAEAFMNRRMAEIRRKQRIRPKQ